MGGGYEKVPVWNKSDSLALREHVMQEGKPAFGYQEAWEKAGDPLREGNGKAPICAQHSLPHSSPAQGLNHGSGSLVIPS